MKYLFITGITKSIFTLHSLHIRALQIDEYIFLTDVYMNHELDINLITEPHLFNVFTRVGAEINI